MTNTGKNPRPSAMQMSGDFFVAVALLRDLKAVAGLAD